MTHAINALAAARDAVVTASEDADRAHKVHSALLVRLSEAQARSAGAETDFRAGKIDETVSALRKSIADADAKDIQAMIDQNAPVLARLNENLERAKARAPEAERAARREELQLIADELKQRGEHLEKLLLELVAERVRVHEDMNPPRDPNQRSVSNSRFAVSTYGIYKPSEALENLVRQNVLPRA